MMATIYTTRQDEVLDAICHRHYGRTREVTEIVLAANPGLAALGVVMPFGTPIVLPDIAQQSKRRPLVGLWD